MKTADPALIALLATGSFVKATLYTITLFDGTVLRYTDADVNITNGTNVWSSQGPKIDKANSRTTGHWKLGVDVDTWVVTVMPRSIDTITQAAYPDLIGTTPWLSAARAGALDGATVQVDRGYLAAWPTPWTQPVTVAVTGIVTIFTGRVAEVDVGRTHAILNINSLLDLFTAQMPRNMYQSQCRWTLFDSGCTLSAAAFVTAGTVLGGSSGNSIMATLAQADGYFDLGRIVMTSGKNNGFARTVRSWVSPTLKLIAPFALDIVAGDTFNVYPGCDKTKDTCTNKFANLVNYGGQDFIPTPEVSI